MKQLVNHPVLLALILTLPLWIVLGNFIVALITALLISFLLSMFNALRVLSRKKPGEEPGRSSEDKE